MLTAHLPSGYCLERFIQSRAPLILPAALVGAVFPDLDMLFFHFVDHGAVHHHRYWVHVPAFWFVAAMVCLPMLRRTRYLAAGCIFIAAIIMHLVLDSIGGGIMWLYPINTTLYEIVTVSATLSHWVWSFLLHWTIALEAAIWGLADAFFVFDNRRRGSPNRTEQIRKGLNSHISPL